MCCIRLWFSVPSHMYPKDFQFMLLHTSSPTDFLLHQKLIWTNSADVQEAHLCRSSSGAHTSALVLCCLVSEHISYFPLECPDHCSDSFSWCCALNATKKQIHKHVKEPSTICCHQTNGAAYEHIKLNWDSMSLVDFTFYTSFHHLIQLFVMTSQLAWFINNSETTTKSSV